MTDILLSIIIFVVIVSYLAMVYSACRGNRKSITLYLGLIVFFIDASFRSRADMAGVSLDWQSFLKLSIFLGAFVIGFAHSKKYLKKIKNSPAIPMLLFILWAICTSIYSPIPGYTFGAAFSFLSLFLFILVVTQRLTNRQILYTISFSLGLLIFFSWVAYLLDFEIAYTYNRTSTGQIKRFDGLGGSSNSMGRLTSLFLLTLFLLHIYKLSKLKELLVPSAVGILTLAMTWSRSSMLALVAVIATFYFRKRPYLLFFCFVFIISLFLYSEMKASSGIDSLVLAFSRTGSLTEIYSLTGRTKIWAFVWDKFMESPIIGYGYASSRVIIPGGYSSTWGFTTTTAHNMLLQSLLDTGLIGTSLLLLTLFNLGIRWLRNPYPVRTMGLIYVLILGLFESGPIGSIPSMLSFFLMLSFYWKDSAGYANATPALRYEDKMGGGKKIIV